MGTVVEFNLTSQRKELLNNLKAAVAHVHGPWLPLNNSVYDILRDVVGLATVDGLAERQRGVWMCEGALRIMAAGVPLGTEDIARVFKDVLAEAKEILIRDRPQHFVQLADNVERLCSVLDRYKG